MWELSCSERVENEQQTKICDGTFQNCSRQELNGIKLIFVFALLTKCHILFHFHRLTSLKMLAIAHTHTHTHSKLDWEWVSEEKGFSCVYSHGKRKFLVHLNWLLQTWVTIQLMCCNKKNSRLDLDSLFILGILNCIALAKHSIMRFELTSLSVFQCFYSF